MAPYDPADPTEYRDVSQDDSSSDDPLFQLPLNEKPRALWARLSPLKSRWSFSSWERPSLAELARENWWAVDLAMMATIVSMGIMLAVLKFGPTPTEHTGDLNGFVPDSRFLFEQQGL